MASYDGYNDTATNHANQPYYCCSCGELLRDCYCWAFLPTGIEEPNYAKFTKNIACNVLPNIISPNTIRRTLSPISGMRGIKLMKRLNKR